MKRPPPSVLSFCFLLSVLKGPPSLSASPELVAGREGFWFLTRGLFLMVDERGCNGSCRGSVPDTGPPPPPWPTFLCGFPQVPSWLASLSGWSSTSFDESDVFRSVGSNKRRGVEGHRFVNSRAQMTYAVHPRGSAAALPQARASVLARRCLAAALLLSCGSDPHESSKVAASHLLASTEPGAWGSAAALPDG